MKEWYSYQFTDGNQWNGKALERVVLRVGISGTSLEWSGTSQFAGRNQWDEFGYDWNEFSFRVWISGTSLGVGISGTSLEWSGTSQFAGRNQWNEFGMEWNESICG